MKPNRLIAVLIAAFLTFALACDKQEPAKSEGAEPADDHAHEEHAGDDHAHAQHGYEPGSHEDWCGEHQVPESMCTRCNESLIPAFKATGDWCDEHELPKSQCLACDPDLKIERPPKKETQ